MDPDTGTWCLACPGLPVRVMLRHHDIDTGAGIGRAVDVEAGLTQIRVHELASELNVGTHQVLSYLEDLGQKVRGPSTVIGVSAAAKVRGRFRSAKPARVAGTEASVVGMTPVVGVGAGVVAAATVRAGAANGASGTPPEGGLRTSESVGAPASSPPRAGAAPANDNGAPGPAQSLFLPPVAPVAASSLPRSTSGFSNPFAMPTARTAPEQPAARADVVLRAPKVPAGRAPLAQAAPQVVEPEPDFDALWENRGISQVEQEAWLDAGLRPGEAQLADRCRSAGIAPAELSGKLSGRTALQRLRDGEATTSVWARIREAEQQPRRAGTKLTGRFQLS